MNKLILIKPDKSYINEMEIFVEEFQKLNENIHGSSGIQHYPDLNEWFEHIKRMENKETVPALHVPSTTYLSVIEETKEIIGIISIRHYLDENLKRYGGHIGYSIRPSKRRLGYGYKQLELALHKCKEFKIKEALVTCDYDNIGSKKIILKNNGIFDSKIVEKNQEIERYWIKI